MYNFSPGTKVSATLSNGEIAVGEVSHEDEFNLWVIDQYGRGPLPWWKESMTIQEINSE